MNLELNLLLDLDLDLDQVIQSMWPPYKAIKCGARPMKKSSLNAWNVSKAAKKEPQEPSPVLWLHRKSILRI